MPGIKGGHVTFALRTCSRMRPGKQADLAWSIRSGNTGRTSDGIQRNKPAAVETARETIQLKGSRHIEEMEQRRLRLFVDSLRYRDWGMHAISHAFQVVQGLKL
jgi:hypothetical protein